MVNVRKFFMFLGIIYLETLFLFLDPIFLTTKMTFSNSSNEKPFWVKGIIFYFGLENILINFHSLQMF